MPAPTTDTRYILVVDDQPEALGYVQAAVNELPNPRSYGIHHLETEVVALRFFREHQGSIACVFMDGSLRSRYFDTGGLIETMRSEGKDIPIIGISSNRTMRTDMCNAGCETVVTRARLATTGMLEALKLVLALG